MKLFFAPDMFNQNCLQVFSEEHDICIGTLEESDSDNFKITSPYHTKALVFANREAALNTLKAFAAKKLGPSIPRKDNQLKLNLQ